MQKLHILKTLIDLFFLFGAIAVGFMVLGVPYILIMGVEDIPFEVAGKELQLIGLGAKLLLVAMLIGAILFLYSIYLLRKVIVHFTKREIFHEAVIAHFNRIGQFIIAASIVTSVPLFFYNLFSEGNLGIEFSGGLDSMLLSLSLGLFFMVLSEVFRTGKNMKEENELTV